MGARNLYVFSVVAAQAKERTSVRRGVAESKVGLEFSGRVCAVLTFLRDKSRAPAAILVGVLNTYLNRDCCLASGR